MKLKGYFDLFSCILSLLCIVGIGIYLFMYFHKENVNCNDINAMFTKFDNNEIFEYVCKSRYWVAYYHEGEIYAILDPQLLFSNNFECASSIGSVFFFSGQKKETPCDIINEGSVDADHFKVSVFRKKGYWRSTIRLVFDNRTSVQINEYGFNRKRSGTQEVLNYLQHLIHSQDSIYRSSNLMTHTGKKYGFCITDFFLNMCLILIMKFSI